MQLQLSLTPREKIAWTQAIGAAIGVIAASFVLPGGDDLYRYYLPFEQGCLECGFVPYFAQWFLIPLRLLPGYPYAWPVWTIVCVAGFLILARRMRINPFWFMVSFPLLGQVWLGQIDVLVCAGIAIYILAKNPYCRGAGMILALTKPQLTALPILMTFLMESPKLSWKIFVLPAAVFLTSLAVYGFVWPAEWISNSIQGLPPHVWRLAAADIWKYGIFLLPAPLLIDDRRRRFQAGLLVSALATPFFGVYSYVTFLFVDVSGWIVALSYSWLLGFFWLQETAMRFAWVLPLAMLARLLYQEYRARTAGNEDAPGTLRD